METKRKLNLLIRSRNKISNQSHLIDRKIQSYSSQLDWVNVHCALKTLSWAFHWTSERHRRRSRGCRWKQTTLWRQKGRQKKSFHLSETWKRITKYILSTTQFHLSSFDLMTYVHTQARTTETRRKSSNWNYDFNSSSFSFLFVQ